LAAAGHRDLVLEVGDDVVDLLVDAIRHLLLFGSELEDDRVTLAVLPQQLRFIAKKIHLPLAQVQDQGRGQHLGRGFQAAAAGAHLAQVVQPRFLCGAFGLSIDQRVREDRELVRIEPLTVRIDEPVGSAELLDRQLGADHVPAELLDLLGEPCAGPAGSRELLLELNVDVSVGDPVGDPHRLPRAGGPVADRQDIGTPGLRHFHVALQRIDRLLAQHVGIEPLRAPDRDAGRQSPAPRQLIGEPVG
jgi:hypothetical protein